MGCRLRSLLVGLALLLLFPPLPSESSETGPLQEGLPRAERVLLVEVISSETRETPAGNIFTYTEFRVLDLLKGDIGTTFSSRVIGGRIGTREVSSPIPPFRPGQRYVLLAGRNNSLGFVTLSPSGVIPVLRDAMTGKDVVEGPFSLRLFQKSTGSSYRSSPSQVPLEDFLYSLKRALRNTASGKREME